MVIIVYYLYYVCKYNVRIVLYTFCALTNTNYLNYTNKFFLFFLKLFRASSHNVKRKAPCWYTNYAFIYIDTNYNVVMHI